MPVERVRRLLVTGEYDRVYDFWRPLMMALNWIETRGNTFFFTLWNDPPMLDLVISSAQKAHVTVQELEVVAGAESYKTLHEETGAGLWE